MTKNLNQSVQPEEVAQFEAEASEWWNPQGFFKPLHHMNPCRLGIIKDHLCAHFKRDANAPLPLEGLNILDIGCGGGLLTEPLTRLGATVTGIDAGEKNIHAAQKHADAMGLSIDYHATTAEAFALEGKTFDCVISLEVLEHLAQIPPFLEACQDLLSPSGTLILSTLNRTARSFLGAIVAGEYILRWLPVGTHDWKKFLRPSEVARLLEEQNLSVQSFKGMAYKPITGEWVATEELDINYFTMATHSSYTR